MTGPIRTIVVGIGEIGEEDRHLAPAVALAESLGATLEVVHGFRVPDPILFPYADAGVFSPEAARDREESVRAQLESQVRSIAASEQVRCHAVPGPPDLAVLRVAEETGAQLVMVGATKGGLMSRAILGTTAQRIVRAARAPVLVVRQPGAGPARRVLLTTDLSELSERVHERALDMVAALFGSAGPELRTVLVMEHDEPLPPPAKEVVAKEQGERGLREFLDRVRSGGRVVEGVVRVGDPAREVVAEAAEWGAGLVVLGTHGRTGASRFLIGSVAERILRRAECDLLVLPTAALRGAEGGK